MDSSLKFNDAPGLLDLALSYEYFTGDDPAMPYHRVDGEGGLVVVVGENASGKSFFRRMLHALCQDAANRVEFIGISMEARRTISYNPWLALVYGDESYQSTGQNSMSTILTGMTTCQDRKSSHVIFWDEPDLGLSDGWAAGVGRKLCAFAKELPKHTKAAVVVTHSRSLVTELLPANPTYIHFGVPAREAPPTLQDWASRPIIPLDPEKLGDLAHDRFRKIQTILDRKEGRRGSST